MAEDKRNEPLKRLLNLVFIMQEPEYRGGMTIDEIAKILGKSERTARRMIKALIDLDCVVVSEPDPSKDFDKRKKALYKFIRLNNIRGITASELGTLERVSKNKRNNQLERNELSNLLKKLRNITEDKSNFFYNDLELIMQTEGFAVRPTPKCKVDEETINKIREAIRDNVQIRCDYENKSGEKKSRLLSPLGFLYGIQKTYLIARMDGKGDTPLTFAVHKISNVRRGLHYFDRGDFNLHEYANKAFGVWHDENNILNVKLSFKKELADAVLNYDFHPTQEIKQEEDGSVTVTFHACGENEILWHIFTWGNNCKILEPTKLKDKYIEMLDSVKKEY